MNQLVKIEAARQALAEAKEIKDVKVILDKAEAVKHFLKQQNCTIEIQNYANVFCIEAQIKLGEMLKEMPKNEGGGDKKSNQYKEGKITPTKTEGVIQNDTPTYQDLNITYKDASRCQQMAENKKEILHEIDRRQSETIQTPIIATRLVNTVLQDKQREERRENILSPLPENKYRTIVIDPPWPMEKILRDVTPNQNKFDYPTMSLEEISKIKLPAADNCHVFMWITQKLLPEGFEIFNSWGVRYVLTMVWHKSGGFQPFGLPQYNCEFILYGRIGTPAFVDTKQFNTCFSANRTGHSEKPEVFYQTLCRVTESSRIDMFGRRNIAGFDKWGKE